MPEAPPVTMARFPLRSTSSITSAAVELNPKFVVIRSMSGFVGRRWLDLQPGVMLFKEEISASTTYSV
jgi:hypothetical protein